MNDLQQVSIEFTYTSKKELEYALKVISEIKEDHPDTVFCIKAVGSF